MLIYTNKFFFHEVNICFQLTEFAAWLKEKDAKDRINRRGPMFHVYKHFPGFTDPKKPIHSEDKKA